MIINRLDYTSSKNITIYSNVLKISNVNFLSKTITISKESQVFSAFLVEPKISLSDSAQTLVNIVS